MDSVSQIVLGTSLAHLTLGERLGRRALIVGAVLGTLPDLDVLVPYADAIESFTYHRSWSHSLFLLSLISLPIAGLVQRLFHTSGISYKRCLLGVWLVLFTHPLLDIFTTYGTQLFWPLMPPPTALGSVFIIDPLYTLPLGIALAVACQRTYHQSYKIVAGCLLLSTAYLAWTLIAQHQVRLKLEDSVARLGIEAQNTIVAPFPLALLWRTVVQADDYYYEGFSSLLDASEDIELSRYDYGKTACIQWMDSSPVQRLDWFTQGQFKLGIEGNELIATDLRIGVEGSYIFRFVIGEKSGQQWRLIQTRQLPVDVDPHRMKLLVKRTMDETISLPSLGTPETGLETDCSEPL